MENGVYVIAGEFYDGSDVVAGAALAKQIKRKLRTFAQKALKAATPLQSMASIAMPALAPAAAASAMANKVAKAAKGGHKPARVALRYMAKGADEGDLDAQRFMSILQRVSEPAPQTLLNGPQLRELAQRGRQGNVTARRVLEYVAGLADGGDPAAQSLLEQAAGSTRWDLVSGYGGNVDLEIMGCAPPQSGAADIISGGALWDFLRPRRGTRGGQTWGPRDAYRLGIKAVSPR